jgi:nitrogen fixation protein FixH
MKPSSWRWFPLAIAGGIGLVVAVNIGMVYAAIHTFPGKSGDEGFALSNHYDAVLAQVERDAALGWSVVARADGDGRPVVTLTGPDGVPLRGASVAARAERPIGAEAVPALSFTETAPGRYAADASLPAAGQWDLTLSVTATGHEIAATRRVYAP